jgi:peptidoglycan/LPS O-acetylase OafA/YrhL
MQFFWGVFLCDLQNHPKANDFLNGRPRIARVLAIFFLVFGCFIASYPEGHPEWQAWSEWQRRIFVQILPADSEFPRFGSGIGLQLITLGIHCSPLIKDVLSGKYLLWLGKQSFAVYLLHGPLLRWVLCWMVYGPRLPADVVNDAGEVVPGKLIFPGNYKLLMWLPIWIPLNYGAAVLWTTYVDPWCARLTEQVVSHVKEDFEEKQGGVLLPQ